MRPEAIYVIILRHLLRHSLAVSEISQLGMAVRSNNMRIVEDDKWQEERTENIKLPTTPSEILAISYLVMETLEPLIKNKKQIYFEQASSYVASYNFCKKALAKIKPLCMNMPEYHDWLFDFFDKELFNDFDVLSWWYESPIKSVLYDLKQRENGQGETSAIA